MGDAPVNIKEIWFWLSTEPGNLCVIFALSLSVQNLLELEVDLDNLELDDIDTTDINLDEDILDD